MRNHDALLVVLRDLSILSGEGLLLEEAMREELKICCRASSCLRKHEG